MIDDGLDVCKCGHIRYHHRPECTDWDGCECREFDLASAFEVHDA